VSEYEIVAISSRRRDSALELASQFEIPNVFTDPNDLIHYQKVDVVIVLPPAPQHAALARLAIAARKDVYCEWPLTTNIVDTEDQAAEAQPAQTHHVAGLQRRMGASARYVRDLLAEGYLGKIRSVRMPVSMAGRGLLLLRLAVSGLLINDAVTELPGPMHWEGIISHTIGLGAGVLLLVGLLIDIGVR
jgi:predicted dehydrogenase